MSQSKNTDMWATHRTVASEEVYNGPPARQDSAHHAAKTGRIGSARVAPEDGLGSSNSVRTLLPVPSSLSPEAASINKNKRKRRCESPKWWMISEYRDKAGCLMHLLVVIGLVLALTYAVTADKPHKHMCHKYPCMTPFDAFEHSIQRFAPPAAPPYPMPPPPPPLPVAVEAPWTSNLCMECIQRCQLEGSCILTCQGDSLSCYDANGGCGKIWVTECVITSNCELDPMKGNECVLICTQDTLSTGASCRQPPPPPIPPPPMPPPNAPPSNPSSPPAPPPGALQISIHGCMYLNSHTCIKDGKMECLQTTCFHDLEQRDNCLPPNVPIDDARCKGFASFDQCMFFGDVNKDWILKECTLFEQSAYHQLMRGNIFLIYAEVCGAILVLTTAFIKIQQYYPGDAIIVVHVACSFAMFCAIGVSAITFWPWSCLWGMLFFCHALYFPSVQRALHDAELMMFTATTIMEKHPLMAVLALSEVVAKLSFFMAWVWVYITISSRLGVVVDVLLFIALVWFAQVMRYTVFTAIAGATAMWYFGVTSSSPTSRAWMRATTTSMGSVCIGSMAMLFIQTPKVLVAILRAQPQYVLAPFSGFLVVMDWLFVNMNVCAFSQMAVYGKDFTISSLRASKHIMDAGFKRMMIDDLLVGASLVAAVLVGLTGCGLSFILVLMDVHGAMDEGGFNGSGLYLIAAPSFVIGALTGLVALDVMEAVVTSFYTCFAEDPSALEHRDPDLYTDFVQAWYEANHPDENEDSNADSEFEEDELEQIPIEVQQKPDKKKPDNKNQEKKNIKRGKMETDSQRLKPALRM